MHGSHGAKNNMYNTAAINLGHAIAAIRHLLHAITTSNSLDVDIRRGGLRHGIFHCAVWTVPDFGMDTARKNGMWRLNDRPQGIDLRRNGLIVEKMTHSDERGKATAVADKKRS